MTTVMFGGTFNPVHCGHLRIARSLISQYSYDRVLLVPAMIPAHKPADERTEPNHRLNMLQSAVQDIQGIVIDDCEIARGGVSYTIDTVMYVYKRYQIAGTLGLLIGDDLAGGFSTWKRVDDLVSMVDLIVAHRISAQEIRFPYAHRYLDNAIFHAASKDIRMKVSEGADIAALVPMPVRRYIEENSLYRN